MGQDSQKSSTTGSKIYILIAVIVLLFGVGIFYAVEDRFSIIVRIVGLIAVIVGCLVIVYLSPAGKKAVDFIGDARTEVRKVIWPTRQETVQMSLVVLFAVILVGLFLWAVDSLFIWLIEIIIN